MLQATINPRSITPHPSNPRRDIGDVTDLAASIAAVGLLETPPEPEPDGDLEGDDLQDDEDFAYDEEEDA